MMVLLLTLACPPCVLLTFPILTMWSKPVITALMNVDLGAAQPCWSQGPGRRHGSVEKKYLSTWRELRMSLGIGEMRWIGRKRRDELLHSRQLLEAHANQVVFYVQYGERSTCRYYVLRSLYCTQCITLMFIA